MGQRAKSKKPKGSKALYMTRAKALKRTQLRLAEFRRLCILKGVYPREPRKKFRGPTATYYHVKDISSLNRDRLMQSFRTEAAYEKKIQRAVGRREMSVARHIVRTKPNYTLSHLVKERYPTLLDAVRDLDDPLSTLALFASLPADDTTRIKQDTLKSSTSLIDQFHFLVGEMGLLRKAFVSIKGYYFQAEILGHGVTWLLPHNYTQEIPFEVDFRVLLTFHEFYACLLKFVNFKLYALDEVSYPPSVNEQKHRMGIRHLALTARRIAVGTQRQSDADDVGSAAEEGVDENEDLEMTSVNESPKAAVRVAPRVDPSQPKTSGLFSGLTIFISREVPLGPLSLILRSGGAVIGWDNDTSPVDMENPSITHQLVDRTTEQLESLYDTWNDIPPRTYIQPQWAVDCMNNGCLLPSDPYLPGLQPPPHLSPFVDDVKDGYVPKQREILDELVAERRGGKRQKQAKSGVDVSDDDEEDEDDKLESHMQTVALAEKYQQEIEHERQGNIFSHEFAKASAGGTVLTESSAKSTEIAQDLLAGDAKIGLLPKTNTARKQRREREELERRAAMMSNRKRKLKARIDDQDAKAKKKTSLLEAKRLAAANA